MLHHVQHHQDFKTQNRREKKMKEKYFKFRESFAKSISLMNDKEAGEFVKALCEYVFEGKIVPTNNKKLRSKFQLAKITLDAEKRDKENGRKGGIKSAEQRKQEHSKVAFAIYPSVSFVDEILSDLLEEEDIKDDNPHVAKSAQNKAG